MPDLVWDGKFEERPQRDQIAYLKKLCSSQNDALAKMQTERDEWREKAKVLEQQAKNAEDAFYAQKAIVQSIAEKSNEDKEQYAKRIQELEANGDNN